MDYIKLLQKTILISFLLISNLTNSFSQNAGTDKPVCSSTTTLSAIPENGVWSTTGGAEIVNISLQNTQVNNLDPGTNTFTWTVSGLGSDEVVITNNEVFVNAGTDVSFNCSTTNTLNGNVPTITGTGVWTMKFSGTGVLIDNSNSNTSAVSNLQIGDNVLVWTISDNGCSASDEVIINNSLPINEAGNDQAACSNTFNLNAEVPTASGTGTWNLTATGTGIFADINLPNSSVQVPQGLNVFNWEITDNGCTASKQFTITNNQVLPNAGINQDICSSTTNLQAFNLLPAENGVWSVVAPQGETFSNASITNPLVNNIKQGLTTFTWTVSNGICTDTDEVQITNNTPTIDAGPDVTICNNYFQLAANIPETGSIGIWTNTNPAIVIADPTKYNTQTSNLSNGINLFTWTIDNGDCSVSDNVSITSNFIDVVAGNPHTEDCSDSFVLNATDPQNEGSGTGIGFWTVSQGLGVYFDNSNSNATTARNLTGFNRLKWTIIDNSCTFSDEIEYVNNLPSQASTTADKIVCSASSILSAAAPGLGETGLWTIETGSGNAIIDTPSDFQTSVQQLDQGTNSFRWTISNNNCITFDIITITNDEVIANAGGDEAICSSSYTLSATISVGNGYWTTTSTTAIIDNSTSPVSTVSSLSPGSNIFTWTAVENSCSAADDVMITDNTPQDITAGVNQIVCEDLAVLSGSDPISGTGLWQIVSGSGSFVNASFYNTNVSDLTQGPNVFRWTVTRLGCSASATVQVDRNSIEVSAGLDSTICNLDVFGLDGTAPGTGITGLWTVNGGTGTFSDASLYNSDLSDMTKGINTYIWTLTDGYCTNFAEVVITSSTPDEAIVGADQLICVNQTTVNAVAVSNGIGSWSVVSGGGLIVSSLLNNTVVNDIEYGVNTFRWTVTKNGCSLFADQIVTNNTVDAAIAESEIVICTPSHTVTLTGNVPVEAGSSGLWTKLSIGVGIIESPSNYQTLVSGLDNGVTQFRWTITSNTCSGFDEVDVVNDYYTTTAIPVGSDAICIDNTPILGGDIPQYGTGLWTASNLAISFDNSQNQATTVRDLPIGTSTLTWTVTKDACDASASFDITNNFIATNAGSDIITCENTAVLNAQALNPNESGLWTANNVVVSFSNPSLENTGISNIPAGASLLTWTISALGCTASDDINVLNNSFQVTAGNDVTICGTDYSLYGSDPLAQGSGQWSVLEGSGLVANISNYSTPVSNLSNGTNSFQWSVTRYGCTATDIVMIINDLYVAEASGPSAVCIDEATLNATALPVGSGATGAWTTLNGGGICQTPDQEETLVLGLAPGNNTFRWTVTKGACISYNNVIVENNEITVYAGPNQATCEDIAYLFATPLSATGIGEWTVDQPSVIITDNASPSTQVSGMIRGVNTFTWTVTDKGCTGSSSLNVTNNDFDAYAGEDQMVTVSTTNMGATLPDASAIGAWSIFTGNASFTDDTDPVTAVGNLTPGTNQYRWTVSWNSCSAFDNVVVIYNLASSDAGADQQLCTDNTVLSASNPDVGTGVWTVVSGTGTFQDPAKYNTTVSNVARGNNTYRWTVTAYEIAVYDEVTITNNSFDISAGTDIVTCDWTSTLNAESPGTIGSGQWTIYRGAAYFTDNQSENTMVESYQDGINEYVWNVQRGDCFAKDTVRITFTTPPTTANAGSDIDLCENSAAVLAGNSLTVGTGLWTASDNTVSISGVNLPDATVTNLPAGATVFTWTATNGNCVSSDDVLVRNNTSVTFIAQPESQQLNEGGTVIFTMETTGDITAYQWRRNGTDMSDDSRITGTGTDSLIISYLNPNDAGQYSCMLGNFCNDVESGIATLSVVSGIEDLEANGIKIYPNPSNGIFNIEFENSNIPDDITITALNGQKVFYKTDLSSKEAINISKSGSGIYIINIQKAGEIINVKIIINR